MFEKLKYSQEFVPPGSGILSGAVPDDPRHVSIQVGGGNFVQEAHIGLLGEFVQCLRHHRKRAVLTVFGGDFEFKSRKVLIDCPSQANSLGRGFS